VSLPPPPDRDWVDPEPVPREALRGLTGELGLPPELAELLLRRGVEAPPEARRFLRPSFEQLHPPGDLPGMEPAVRRVLRARDREETVLVHGDYDADGVCAAALLTRGLRELGLRVEPFVPHRTRDGYDLGPAGLARARESGATLVVTADCGISAAPAVESAREEGIDVVITDHHRPPERLPDAVAAVDPVRRDSQYPFPGLAGVGVAYKLLTGLWQAAGRPREELNPHLDLVALGTVADMVPLRDENRALVRAGLEVLGRSRKAGIRALARGADVDGPVTAEAVAYRLAPRLNSAGRMGEAESALRLLLTGDAGEARRLADRLERLNGDRRREDGRVQEDAEARVAEGFRPSRDRAVVAWGEDWHPGVIGIVASRLVERLHRPVILVTLRDGVGRGSGRSIRGFPLRRALSECAPLLERFGGHRMAAGLEIRPDRLEEFRERFKELAARELEPGDLHPRLALDLVVPLGRAGEELAGWLGHLSPFGTGNDRPLLASRDVAFRDAAAVGRDGGHLKATLVDGEGARVPAIGFGLGHRVDEARGGRRWDVAYELVEDRWRGRRRVQARIRDFRPRS
jgi:single-stranded-DNA-specific exonuclease